MRPAAGQGPAPRTHGTAGETVGRTVDGVAARGPSRVDRWFAVGFAIAAVLLAPWIVDLYLTQAYVGVSAGLVLTSVGILAVLAIGLLLSALACWRGSRYTVIPVSFTGVLAATIGFFHIATGTAASPGAAVVSAIVVFLPIVVLAGWVAVRHGPPHHTRGVPRWASIAFAMAAVVMIPVLVRTAATSPATRTASHLRLTWTVLDVVELVTILGLAAALWRGSAAVAATATATAALLFSDVWFNVLATTGDTQTSGLEMSATSLPLAAVALAMAVRALRLGATTRAH